jgi:hypothetical protein
MLRIHHSAAALLAAGLAVSVAHAQVSQVAYTTDDDDPFGARNTDAGVSVNDQAVLTTANMRVSLFGRTGSILDWRQPDGTNPNAWPFHRVDTGVHSTLGPSRFFDPQTVYHPQEGRLWMVYSEENVTGGTPDPTGTPLGNVSALHIAVSKEMTGGNTLNSLTTDDWWYYTGVSVSGVAGDYFNMQDPFMSRYESGGSHNPFSTALRSGLVDKPHMAVDEQAAYITMNGFDPGPSNYNAIVIIPTSHGPSGSLSILDGDKPAAGDLVFLRNPDLPATDTHARHYTVQEPFEQLTNAQFILSLDGGGGQDSELRLAGLWFNDAQGKDRWEYSQRVQTGTTSDFVIDPMMVDADFLYMGGADYQPLTPDPGSVSPPRDAFRPRVSAAITFFPSAVLVKINNNDWRIFAVHHVRPVDDQTTEAEDQWVIQWYVIDPHLDKFRAVGSNGSTPSTEWKPTIETTGRLDTAGDRYHPVIGVTQQGVAYIEYTYSSNTVWPEVRRVTLNSSYDDIVANSEVTVKAGPSNYYDGAVNGWADFADMQADPVTGCAFWSTHTLVHTADTGVNDKRDVRLFQTLFNCGNSNLNFDGGTDAYDLALFNSFYSTGARRVDMNTDGTTDAADAAIYSDAYDAATQP